MDRVSIVLARPREAGNIGGACRAMHTMGLRTLVVAEGPADNGRETEKAAGPAAALYASRVESPELRTAIAPYGFVVGVTRRSGQRRKYAQYGIRDAVSRALAVGDAGAAFVFGNETSGLSDDELSLCHVAAAIPSSPRCPSLNLAHAVQVVAYELAKAASDTSATRVERHVHNGEHLDGAGLSRLTAEVIDCLHRIGFVTREGPQGMRVFLRDVFARSGLTNVEAGTLREVFFAYAHAGNTENEPEE